jgi:ABC-type sugar transport system, permease component
MAIKKSKVSIAFDSINYILLTLIAITCIIPFIYVLSASLVPAEELLKNKFVLIPKSISFTAYRYILSSETILRSLGISVFITVVGTAINMFMTCITAYPLSRKKLRGRNAFQLMIIFTMLFNGGMIPSYLVVSSLKLLNTFWALWLPGAISAFNLILIRNFFMELPEELFEAAKIDGCGEWRTLFILVLPLSLPSLAAFSLFYAVGHWNSFFSSILYIKDSDKWPIQVWLRQIVLLSSGGFSDSTTVSDMGYIPPQNIVYAVIIFATLPILIIYPFLQKYFAKGVLVGSVKG